MQPMGEGIRKFVTNSVDVWTGANGKAKNRVGPMFKRAASEVATNLKSPVGFCTFLQVLSHHSSAIASCDC